VEKWLSSLGIEQGSVKPELQKAVSESGSTLIDGISHAISGLAELATFLTLSAFTTFFYLKDGPSIRAWVGAPNGRARIRGSGRHRRHAGIAARLLREV
jgi:predicted PurR-regulated permease PerM